MKKTAKDNIEISKLIGYGLGVTFKNEEFSLGKWGEVDNWCEIAYDTIVLVEFEKAQKHPNTNVLKLFPYLEVNSDIKIILIHYFYPDNKVPKNRLALCSFIAEKMSKEFEGRFQYINLNCSEGEIENKIKEHNRELMQQFWNKK